MSVILFVYLLFGRRVLNVFCGGLPLKAISTDLISSGRLIKHHLPRIRTVFISCGSVCGNWIVIPWKSMLMTGMGFPCARN